jgi:hypothetical protein
MAAPGCAAGERVARRRPQGDSRILQGSHFVPARSLGVHNGRWFNVYCFAEAADADKFMKQFGGEKFDPRQRGKREQLGQVE